MPTIAHKQLLNVPNTTVGGTACWKMQWALAHVTKAAGWKYAGSSDGSVVNKTTDPAQDRWNGTPGTLGTLTSSGSGAVVDAPARGRTLVTGLTGVVSSWKGQFLKITGSSVSANNNVHQIEEIISATSVKIDARNFAVGADAVGRSWEIRDPLGEAYNSALTASLGWHCSIGPHVLRIPITSAPSARMLPGERIVQASSGFEGELRDYVWNQFSSTGYLVAMGHVRGTGGGVYGLTTGQVFTGQTSNVTVTQNGTAREFRLEYVITKNSGANGETIGCNWFGVFEPGIDSSFSSQVASAGCAAPVPPGGGGTGNAFPTYAWIATGTSNSTFTSLSNWARVGNPIGNTDACWAICADAIEEQGYSADGSCMAAVLARGTNTWSVIGVQLCDGGEVGDCAPWVSITPPQGFGGGDTNVTRTQTTTAASGVSADGPAITDLTGAGNPHNPFMRGWVRRGATGDSWAMYECTIPWMGSLVLISANNQNSVLHTRAAGLTGGANSSAGSFSQTHEEHVPVLLPVGVCANRTPLGTASRVAPIFKSYKGSLRWSRVSDCGHVNDLHDGTFLQLAGSGAALCVGPFNGTAPALSSVVPGRLRLTPTVGFTGSATNMQSAGYDAFADGTVTDSASSVPANPGGVAWEAQLTAEWRKSAITRNCSDAVGGYRSSFLPAASASTAWGRFTSQQLAAQTISGTVKGQAYAVMAVAQTGIYMAARLYVVTPTGAIRGVIRELLAQGDTSGGTEIPPPATATNRKIFRNGTLTSLAVLAGDRLVLELGVMATGATQQVRVSFNDLGTGTSIDLPEDEVTTTTLRQGWIEFSNPIVFLDSPTEKTVLISGPSTIGGQGYSIPSGGGAVLYYLNRVYDSVASQFVHWATTSPDSTGTSYPGPGTFGVTTSNYCVVTTYTV